MPSRSGSGSPHSFPRHNLDSDLGPGEQALSYEEHGYSGSHPPPRPGWTPSTAPPRPPGGHTLSSSCPSAARRPHTHPLRRACWEPLAEAKRNTVDPLRPGSPPTPAAGSGPGGGVDFQIPASRPPTPASPATQCTSWTRAYSSLSQRGDECAGLKKNLFRIENKNKTRAKPRYKSAWTEDPAPDAIPNRYPEV